MIDQAVIDLMHEMSMSPLAIVRTAAVEGASSRPEDGQRFIDEIERDTLAWTQGIQERFSGLIEQFRSEPQGAKELRYLDQMIETFEAQINRSAREDRRHLKRTRVIVKRHKVVSARNGVIVAMQGTRAMRALAQIGDLKQEVVFALRALRFDLNGTARTGPIFADPDEMMAYLRAAVA